MRICSIVPEGLVLFSDDTCYPCRDELKSRVDMAAADGRIISDAEENMFRKVS